MWVFKDIDFSLQIEPNLKEVDFQDASPNLWNGTYHPYKSPKDIFLHPLFIKPPTKFHKVNSEFHPRETQKMLWRK